MSKTVSINGESKTVDKVALWRDSSHTAREMFVPEGTVPEGYVPDAVPTVTAAAGISRSGHIVTASAYAEAACHGHTASDSDTESIDLTQGTGLEAAAILAGRSVLGISGTATADATAAAADIASGKTAYINGVKVTGQLLPETCPVPSYDTPIVSVSVGLSADNSKVTASASATANGKTGNGTGEATLTSLGLVKPARTQAGGTITPGAQQVIPAGTYLSAALTILAASGGLPSGLTKAAHGTFTQTANETYKTVTHNLGVEPLFVVAVNRVFAETDQTVHIAFIGKRDGAIRGGFCGRRNSTNPAMGGYVTGGTYSTTQVRLAGNSWMMFNNGDTYDWWAFA